MTYIPNFRPLSCLQTKIYAYAKVDIQSDFSILSDPISQKWGQPHLKPLNSAFQWYQPFWKIPTTARDMNFRIQTIDFYEKTLPVPLPEALWRHSDVIGQNKFQIRNLLCWSFDLSIHKPTFWWKKFLTLSLTPGYKGVWDPQNGRFWSEWQIVTRWVIIYHQKNFQKFLENFLKKSHFFRFWTPEMGSRT